MWAALFPGQGSQHSGMGQYLYDNFKIAQELFEEASDTLNLDFKKLCFSDSSDELAHTENTQPALLLVSTAAYHCFKSECDFTPVAGAGHSVGEYAAVVASEAISFVDALKAVRARGQAMQQAVPLGQGGMAAVMGLTPDQVQQLCTWAEQKTGTSPMEAANFNAPGQIVISGRQEIITWLKDNLDKDIFSPPPKRVRLIPLNVSAPFHCSMMKPATATMEQLLNDTPFRDAQFPIVQNVDAKAHKLASEIRKLLVAQVESSVQWVQCVETLADMGVKRCIEFGSGQVLSGLVKKIDSENLATFNMNSLDEFKAVVAAYT